MAEMKFIVQTVHHEVIHDWAFMLERAQAYYEWRGELFTIYYSETVPVDKMFRDHIPVGTVAFVSEFIRTHHPEAEEALMPLNVPESLFAFAGRKIANFNKGIVAYNFDFGGEIYRKSRTIIKDSRNGLILNPMPEDYGGFQVSEVINIRSEWRVIVFKGEVLHVSYYKGDPLVMPSGYMIHKMVGEYKDAPIAYTIDVGVGDRGTFVIECHRFFSCGLYGFNDIDRYPKMLSQAWYEMMRL